jgi:toxin ParE1/3/4
MKLVWNVLAVNDLRGLIAFIAEDNPSAAARASTRILNQTELLASYPFAGRTGRVTGTRERAVPNTPYLIVYKVSVDQVHILRVYHGARKWPKRFN